MVDDQDVVEAFAADGADEAFGDRVRPRCPHRGPDDPDVGAGEDGVEGGGELGVAVADQEPEPVGAVVEVHEQVAGLLGDPGAGRVGGDPGDVHAATVVLDDDENVEPAQEDGVDVGEVDGEDRVGLRGQELSPGRSGSSWRGIESGVLQDRPDGRGGDGVAESDELALDPSIPPAGILAGHAQHQGADRRCGGWSAWPSARVGPAAGDELGVPAQQRPGRHQPQLAQRGRQQPAQRAEHGAVEPRHCRTRVASAQHGDLVTQHQDLDVLRGIGAGEQRQPAQNVFEKINWWLGRCAVAGGWRGRRGRCGGSWC